VGVNLWGVFPWGSGNVTPSPATDVRSSQSLSGAPQARSGASCASVMVRASARVDAVVIWGGHGRDYGRLYTQEPSFFRFF
jgi:hypothetical protein